MEKTYYLTKEQFIAMTAAWKSKDAHTASEHLIYNILRSKPADLGFTEKYKEILTAGDPLKWKAFTDAIVAAKWSIKTRQFGDYKPDVYFKNAFGIDIPADLNDKLDGARK